jgi:hypothetical protein
MSTQETSVGTIVFDKHSKKKSSTKEVMNTEKMDKCNTWQGVNWKEVERQVFKLSLIIHKIYNKSYHFIPKHGKLEKT